MKICFISLLITVYLESSAQEQYKNVYRESAWKERDEWQRAPELIKHLKIKKGSTVADIGCHEGYMTIKLAAIVESLGKVYAVDVEQSKLNLLKDHLQDRKIDNVVLIKGDYDDPKLPQNTLDAVIILDTYHEMDDHDKILIKVKEALKPGGRLLICEPIAESRRNSIRSEQEKRHEVGINFVLGDLKKSGFDIIYQKDPFADRLKIKDDVMWVIVATRK